MADITSVGVRCFPWSMIRFLTLLVFSLSIIQNSLAQKQMIVIRNGIAVARFTEGGKFKCVLKDHQKKEGIIVELNEHSMITTNDTILFQSIAGFDRKNYFRVNIMRDVGGLLFYGGLIYLAADILYGVFQGEKIEFDQSDRTALVAASLGAVILFVKSPYRHVGRKMVIRTVDHTSPYYYSILK